MASMQDDIVNSFNKWSEDKDRYEEVRNIMANLIASGHFSQNDLDGVYSAAMAMKDGSWYWD